MRGWLLVAAIAVGVSYTPAVTVTYAHAPARDVPVCETLYIGPLQADLMDADNWTMGVPREGIVACVPDDVAKALPPDVPFTVRVIPGRTNKALDGTSLPSRGGLRGGKHVPALRGSATLLTSEGYDPPPPPPLKGGEQEDPPLRGGEKSTWDVEQWDPSLWGACCVGSSCVITDAFNCRELDGYFSVGTLICEPEICQTGVCCTDDPDCYDASDLGFPVEESDCDSLGGVFVGGAPACDETDPCARHRIPGGFETIEVSPVFVEWEHLRCHLNDCGEVVYSVGPGTNGDAAEIYLYQSGLLTQITNNDVRDIYPDINNHGTIVWAYNYDGFGGGESWILEDGEITVLGEGRPPRVNDLAHAAWHLKIADPCPDPRQDDIYYYDGLATLLQFDDGLSNQSAETLNDSDEIAWTRCLFECGGGFEDWTSQIMLDLGSSPVPLPAGTDTPQLAAIDNHPRVAWGDFHLVEVWEGGTTTSFGDGHGPALNDRGDLAYSFIDLDSQIPWVVMLLRDNQLYRISGDLDIGTAFDNSRPELNELGEIAWWWRPNGDLHPSGIRLMRRIRNGDMDQDLDTDFDDFIIFSGCMTGPGEFDDLCECRFCDIDHDRDVDADDFSYFMRTYVGPEPDCNANTESDLYDIVNGTSFDCNVNGIPDDCDIDPTDPDGNGVVSEDLNENGIPDECDCPMASPPTGDTYPPPGAFGTKNRYLSISAGDEAKQQAIQVTFASLPGYEYAQGRTRWVQEPFLVPEPSGCSDLDVCPTSPFFQAARLGCDPHYTDWSNLGTMDIYDSGIVPGATFEVRAITEGCDLANPDKYSDPLTITMSRVGDVVGDCGVTPCTAPQGVVDFVDISALVEKFKNTPSAPRKARSDIINSDVAQPLPDQKIDFVDVSYCVDAFRNVASPLPGPPLTDPCPP